MKRFLFVLLFACMLMTRCSSSEDSETASVKVTSITLNNSITLAIGNTETLIATVLPYNATNKSVIWTSSNSAVASVNQESGLVTAIASGTATITAAASDGSGKSASCDVTVLPIINSITLTPDLLYIPVGETEQLTVVITPSNAYKVLEWESDYPAVASVDPTTGVVTAMAPGTTKITVKAQNGNASSIGASATIRSVIPAVDVTVSPQMTSLSLFATQKLTATIIPSNASNQDVIWTSSNPNIVSVNSTGLVTAQALGTATITTATEDGGHTAHCNITVDSDSGVEINGIIWATRNVDAPGTFAVRPEDPGMLYQWGKNVGWSTTDPCISSDNSSWNTSIVSEDSWSPDPCPNGWRVPTHNELSKLAQCHTSSTYPYHGWMFANNLTDNYIFLPSMNSRYQDGNLYSGYLYYLSSLRYEVLTFSHISPGVSTIGVGTEIRANPIRCVRE